MKKQIIRLIAVVSALALLAALTSCSLGGINVGTTAQNTAAAKTDLDPANASSSSEMFSASDKETGVDDEAVTVTLADGASAATGVGVTVNGDTITITAAGSYVISGTLTNGQLAVDADGDEDVRLTFNGVNITNSSSAAFYIKKAEKVIVTLADGSENSLVSSGAFVQTDDNKVDGAVFSKEDLTLNGGGSLTITSAEGHGIVSKDSLVLTGGSVTVTAAKHGVQAKDDFRMLAGDLNITSGKDGVHAENDDDETLGFVYIEGGNITVSADDDGIHAENYLTVEGGNIEILKSYEGLEAKKITVDGGTVNVNASDDGLNAAGGAAGQGFGFWGAGGNTGDYQLTITGGVITVNAGGDGLDSNGVLNITGGEVYVSGPTNAGNGALDYETECLVTGGVVIAAGAAGMAENFSSSSTQGAMLLSVSGAAGDTVTLKDENGTVLASYAPEKAFQTVAISAPGVQAGGTYTVTVGSETRTVEMTSLLYSDAGLGMGFGPGGQGMPGGNPPGRR